MGVLDGYDSKRLQFVADALRTMNMAMPNLDLSKEGSRRAISTSADALRISGHAAVRNGDGTALTIAQIATAANLTVAQVTDLAGRL
jgi:hypothetical protein